MAPANGGVAGRITANILIARPIPDRTVDTRPRESAVCAFQRGLQLAAPLRRRVAKPTHQEREAARRDRSISTDNGVNERVQTCAPIIPIRRRGAGLARRVNPNARLAAKDAKQPLVVQGIEQVRRRVRRPTPVVCDPAVREMTIHFPRMRCATFAHERKHALRSRIARGWPQRPNRPRMHQGLERSSHESVIDEDVLFDLQHGILLLEIAGSITIDTKTERQILSARRRSDWIGLHEPENIDRTRQGRRPPQAADDGHSTEIVECRRALAHQEILARCPTGILTPSVTAVRAP